MGIYYFAVDYEEKLQMWPPAKYANKSPGVYYPTNPFSHMVMMKNIQGYDFKIINDVSSDSEYDFEDITERVFSELKNQFPDYFWDSEE